MIAISNLRKGVYIINNKLIFKNMNLINYIVLFCLFLCSCSTSHLTNGWYPVADTSDNHIEGKAIVTIKDFESVAIDTVSLQDVAFIEGRLKADKVKIWAKATENRIGKRIGFVFKDSVIMAPTINCRIESGTFTINSDDKNLILEIYNSLNNKAK